ncbi:hypothetical protein PV396_43935 [Streptomyces sp. ME02-8801-2C]|uniref:hypothetical protein n=1 Tax=Streptomyces sp. ME02-8801-2C TaxID=3028680 RepID=UPI0029A0516E|nr:hypothetical protein [Streptomyces sp. ME02-8801-2C]MDX3458796.1 hypothetical protein [Streptomyces sp. ME02-8801-2C]
MFDVLSATATATATDTDVAPRGWRLLALGDGARPPVARTSLNGTCPTFLNL